jgi:hypothetical protein
LKKTGAKLTLAIFDTTLHLNNFYKFFIQWVLEDPNLGLLIKSKGPIGNSLREGELESLFSQALKTGRVHVLDHKTLPNDAAVLADFSVGIATISAISNAALKGAKVLYLDYERTDQSILKPYCMFHSLGPNRCVFYDPISLKNAVLEYTNDPSANPNLGDASPILDQIDAFLDNKAGERIGEYVTWYVEGIENHGNRDLAIKNANSKYANKWGSDKVLRNI